MPLIGQIPPGPFKELMARRLTELTGVASGSPRPAPPRPPPARRTTALGTVHPVRRAIALLLQRPGVAALPDLPAGWREADAPGMELLRRLVDLAASRPDIPPAALIERWEDAETRRELNDIHALRLDLIETDIPEHFVGVLRRLAEQARRDQTERLVRKNDLSSLTDEEKERLREFWKERARAPERQP